MKTYSVRQVIKALSKHAWTAIIMNSDGEVTALISREEWPTADFLFELNRDHPDRVMRLIPRGVYERKQIESILADARETFELRDEGLLDRPITTR